MKSYIIGLLIALILSGFALRPILHPGFFAVHDDTQIGRVVTMGRALRLGQFPVRWVSDLGYGYGYPLYNFYGPLPYYIGGALYALGVSGLTATKIIIILGLLLAAGSMYLLAASAFGVWGGLLASVLYSYAPYHAVQIYIRGAVGEFWAYAFLPLLFLGALSSNTLIIALSIFAIVTSHTIMGYIVVLGTIVTALFFRRLWLGLLLGLGLSAFFWLPAIVEQSYTNVAKVIGPSADYRNHFVCLSQLWDSAWGFAGSAPGCIDGVSFRLGKLHILLGFAGLLFFWNTALVRWAAALGAFSLFMMLPASLGVWKIIPNAEFIQYPWRFLMFGALSLSLLGGKVARGALTVVLIAAVLFTYAKLFVPQAFLATSSTSYETEEELRWQVSRISDEYLPPDVPRPKSPSEVVGDTVDKRSDLIMRIVRETDTYAWFRFDAQTEQSVRINKAYFPGWIYKVNSIEVKPRITQGLPEITIPSGESTLEIQFTNTPVRKIGNTVSLVTLIYLLLRYGKTKKAHT